MISPEHLRELADVTRNSEETAQMATEIIGAREITRILEKRCESMSAQLVDELCYHQRAFTALRSIALALGLPESADAESLLAGVREAVKDRQRFRETLATLSGCLPNHIYIYGAYGDQWSDWTPPTDEFEEIDFNAILESSEVK